MRTEIGFTASLYLIAFAVVSHRAQSFRPQNVLPAGRSKYPYSGAEQTNYHHSIMKFELASSPLSSPSSLAAASKVADETITREYPWYSHPDIGRDRSHVQKHYNKLSNIFRRYREEQQQERKLNDECDEIGNSTVDFTKGSKFILISHNKMWHQKPSPSSSISSPLYLTVSQLEDVISSTRAMEYSSNNGEKESDSAQGKEPFVAWVGKYQNEDYWVVTLNDNQILSGREAEPQSKLKSFLVEACSTESEEYVSSLDSKPLREFGDSLEVSHDAGILATANGLVEFHKSHSFCSFCGGPTESSKAGGSRRCTIEGCRRSVYPRIDSATIMLVTSHCENYALLGRKSSWPPGRYSTLAGFCEVGETLEECCARETFEESGVIVDPNSLRFVASQPWPFPRSLMVGFRAKAMASSTSSVGSGLEPTPLPGIIIDTNEMEDIQWFPKDFVKEGLSLSGSTALTFQPNEVEKKIPYTWQGKFGPILDCRMGTRRRKDITHENAQPN
mmetsp:Transcript_1695/g.3659  ORF Transcript_1695/g.3659 Transcript_1695/m.3659 type:complete len:503 (+) Transcript_1695:247-1755(+)